VIAGRGIEPADTAAGAPFVVLLSWGAWQRRYGGSADIIGHTVRLDGKVAAVIGVLERGFDLSPLDASARAEFWLPLGGPGKSEEWAWVLIRRRPGVSVEAITGELRAALQAEGIASDLLERFPPRASGLGEFADEDRERTLWLLTLAVSLVLAIACANVAALLLGQAAVRAREFGVRAALGAGRGRVVRQLVTEAGLLGALGGVAGFAVAKAALWLMRATRPEKLLTLDDVALDPRVTLAGLGLTLSVAVLFGLAPAWAVSRTDAAAALVGRVKRSLDSRFSRSLRSALVVGQLAVSLVLVSGAGLLVKSFLAERKVPIGFDPAGLGWVDFSLSPRLIPAEAERAAIAEEARAVVSRMPELEAVALAGDSPVGHGIIMGEFLIDGRPLPDLETETMIPYRSIGPGYFDAIGARLEAGREPDPASGELEIVVDAKTAERFFPAGDALGSRVRYSRTGVWKTIVGVAQNQRRLIGAFQQGPFVFESRQRGARGGALIVRAGNDVPLQRISALVRATDPRIKIRSAETAESTLDERLAGRRFTMTIMIGFAGLALLLAAVGLYGVVALAVSQRTYEMGVRIALGAAPSSVRFLVLREGGVRVAIGLGLGFVLLIALGRLLRGLLSDVRAWDPVVWGAAAASLALAGVIACWIPARRASRTDPMIALRAE
jgi:predicted permease